MLSLASILALLSTYTYWVIFPIAALEGPIVTVLAGLLISLGYLNFPLTLTVIVLADLFGDILYYAFGRWSHKASKLGPIHHLEKHFAAHSGKTLVIGKFAHGAGSFVLIAAGVVRMPFWEFLFYNLVSTIPKTAILLVIGYYFGSRYLAIDSYLSNIALIISLLVGIIVVVYFVVPTVMGKIYPEKDRPPHHHDQPTTKP